MPAQIGALYVSLTMNSAPFVTGITKAQSATQRAAAAINRDVGLSQRTINAFQSSTGNRSFRPYAIIAASRAYETATDRSNLLRGALFSLTAVAGGFAAALGTNLLTRYADTAVNLSNQLKTVTSSGSNLIAVQTQLGQVAADSRSSLQSTITLYARSARATEQFGFSQTRLLRITETIQKAFAIGGASTAEAQGAAVQLSQGIASDRFSGDEFRSVAENAPVLLRGIAESLGISIGKLRQMSKEGELTASTVVQAILKASGRIDREFAETSINIEQAITQVDNKLLEYVSHINDAYGLTKLLAGGILLFGNNLESIIPGLTTVATLLGSAFLARNKGAIGAGAGALLGGGIGGLVGGGQGAVIGSVLGGLAGFGATKRDERGLGFIGRIRADAAAARQNVISLTEAEKGLRAELLSSAVAANKARRAAEGDLAQLAPGSAKSAMSRELYQAQLLDEKKITLLDKQRESYQRLSAIQSQISPKAAKLADTQVRAELKLTDTLQRQIALQQQLRSIGANEKAQSAVEGTAIAPRPDDVKARIAAEKELGTVTSSIARQEQDLAERRARIAGLGSAADQKAANERIAIGREIYAQTDQLNALDEERTKQVQAAAQARVAAERAGAAAAKESVTATATAYRGVSEALASTGKQLEVARRAASPFGQTMNFLRGQASSLVNLFGGPWGVAITAASLLFAKFAADAQEQAQAIANAKSIIDETLQQTPQAAPAGGLAGGLLSSEITAIGAQIDTVNHGAEDAIIKLRQLVGIRSPTNDPISEIIDSTASAVTRLQNSSIQGAIDKLQTLTVEFIRGKIGISDYQDQVAALAKTADSPRFDSLAAQIAALANTVAGAAPTVDALKQKIIDLRVAAQDPVNLVVNMSFDALDQQNLEPKLNDALGHFAAGKAFTDDLQKELGTLRLVGDARKRAEYTDEEVNKATKAGVLITDAVRKRIGAFVDEKIALENRDAAYKKAEKDDPFERAVKSLQERTAAQKAETAALGLGTYALARAKAAQDLENAARDAKIKMSPDVIATINKEADAAGVAAVAQEAAAKAIKDAQESIDFYRDTFSSFFVDLKGQLLDGASGWDAFATAGANALDKIADRALTMAANGIFDLIFGAVTSGLTGGLGSSIASGVTGAIGSIPAGTPVSFDQGGLVGGVGTGTSDSNLAKVSKGEFVMNAAATKQFYPMIRAMNDNQLGAFASGGLVGGAGAPSITPNMAKALQQQGGPTIIIQNDNQSGHPLRYAQQQSRGPKGETIIRNVIIDTVRDAKARGVKGL